MKRPASKDILFVSIQLLLFIVYIFPLAPYAFQPNYLFKHAALVIAIAGLLMIALAILQLNKNLTPFPTPVESGSLIQTGLYKFIRHPIYSGIILIALGFGFYGGSIWKIIIGFALWILFYFKSVYEEILLTNQYPEYEAYRKNTNRFFPFL